MKNTSINITSVHNTPQCRKPFRKTGINSSPQKENKKSGMMAFEVLAIAFGLSFLGVLLFMAIKY
ncbi:MAG TPA: hypothetical protein VII99_06015 [Bacteroidia bacterium]